MCIRDRIKLAQENEIDVAVLDIRMAGMSGIEVLERLKYVQPDMEAIMMTAFETTDTIRKALQLRACDYINKPFDIATMRAAVSQAMQRRLLESEIHSSAEKVQQLLVELQEQRVEEQIAKTRGDIYASIIHDINGPLTVISGFVQVLNQRLSHDAHLGLEDLEFIKERLRIVGRQTSNCIEISRRYLGFLRKQSEEAPRVNVNQLLHDLDQLVGVHPSRQENEFAVTPLAEDIGVKINGTDVIQLLLNLSVNAFQCATGAHRVEAGGETLHAPLNLAEFKDGPNAVSYTHLIFKSGGDSAPTKEVSSESGDALAPPIKQPPPKPAVIAPPANDTNWLLALGAATIPDAPAAGRIHGQDFITERASFQNGTLTLRCLLYTSRCV